jgi:probable HAF family extracellular repeat protein
MSHRARYALTYLLVALIGVAGCAGNGNSSQMMPGSTLPGGTIPKPHRPAASTVGYSITDLCPQSAEAPCEVGKGSIDPQLYFVLGGAINSLGQAAGGSPNANFEEQATLFSNGKLTNLNTLGAGYSLANAINASGQVAGIETTSCDEPCAEFHAFLYSNGKMTNIENSSLFPAGSQAYGINSSGQVVGVGFITAGNFHAFLYSGGKMVDINPFNGGQSRALSINDSGEIIGSVCCINGSSTNALTWLYANGKFTNLSQTNTGLFINNNGQIVGTTGGDGALYSNGVWTDLHAYQDPSGSLHPTEATGINNKGQIVGFAFTHVKAKCGSCSPPDDNTGLIFTSSGWVNLNTLIPANSGFTITEAVAINDAGQIVADAKTTTNSVPHAVLLTPN